jgi:hypothetical protein
MTPELAWIFAVFRPPGKIEARFGRLPSTRVARTVAEGLIWLFSLGHLEGDIASVAHHLRADLDQLLLQARQRPVLDRLRRCERAQEIAKIVGECMKLEPHAMSLRLRLRS